MKLKGTVTCTFTRHPSTLLVVLHALLGFVPFASVPGHEGVTVMLAEYAEDGARSFTNVWMFAEVAWQS